MINVLFLNKLFSFSISIKQNMNKLTTYEKNGKINMEHLLILFGISTMYSQCS